jgi:hypothetical protein
MHVGTLTVIAFFNVTIFPLDITTEQVIFIFAEAVLANFLVGVCLAFAELLVFVCV